MKGNCCLMPGRAYNSSIQIDLSDRGFVGGREDTVAWGDRARRETECFINGNLHNPTTGWPVPSRMPRRSVA